MGYRGKILRVNLTQGKVGFEPLDGCCLSTTG
jgi:aldehyde:ferredoxin oxidoreductase